MTHCNPEVLGARITAFIGGHMGIKLHGVDAVEFAVKDFSFRENQLKNWGFQKAATITGKNESKQLWVQGKIKTILTKPLNASSYASQFLEKHGDGICDVRFLVDDADQAFNEAVKRGAKKSWATVKHKVGSGEISQAQIAAMGSVTHSFISRKNTKAVDNEFQMESPEHFGFGMFAVDHLTCNVEAGQMETWAAFYEKIFDFKITRFFHITTGRTGLVSKVLENDEGTVKIPVNEPTESKSQIQEYLNLNKGPGVQHLALTTANILETLPILREKGQAFLEVPDTYYDEVPKRIKGIKEDIKELQKHRILADGDNAGYLLQIFSENTVGPFFFEVIQRCGNKGFGEGNFKALFEAIERDQEKRGVL